MRSSCALLKPETVRTVNRAYGAALDAISLRPSLHRGINASDARVVLGRAMMELVETGEMDEASLIRNALLRAFPRCATRVDLLSADRREA